MHGIGSSHSENVELTEKQSQYLLRLHSKSSATLHAATKCILRSFFFFWVQILSHYCLKRKKYGAH